jgi:hypothetical protein
VVGLRAHKDRLERKVLKALKAAVARVGVLKGHRVRKALRATQEFKAHKVARV